MVKSLGRLMLKSVVSSKREGLQFSIVVHRWMSITRNTNKCHNLHPPRLKVKVARSRGLVWQVFAHKSRTKKSQKHHTTGGNVHQEQDERSRLPGWLMLKPKVCRLWTSNLVGSCSMHYQLPWSVKLGCCTRVGHTMSSACSGHTTC